jgi:hypothetical protein
MALPRLHPHSCPEQEAFTPTTSAVAGYVGDSIPPYLNRARLIFLVLDLTSRMLMSGQIMPKSILAPKHSGTKIQYAMQFTPRTLGHSLWILGWTIDTDY